eukprot:scaffold257909_cov66-Attheya_sp.AAC.5
MHHARMLIRVASNVIDLYKSIIGRGTVAVCVVMVVEVCMVMVEGGMVAIVVMVMAVLTVLAFLSMFLEHCVEVGKIIVLMHHARMLIRVASNVIDLYKSIIGRGTVAVCVVMIVEVCMVMVEVGMVAIVVMVMAVLAFLTVLTFLSMFLEHCVEVGKISIIMVVTCTIGRAVAVAVRVVKKSLVSVEWCIGQASEIRFNLSIMTFHFVCRFHVFQSVHKGTSH